ncbi:MAG: hypothetical protein Q9179_006613 [Wetmoreana sp. 5 TL-2023]
MHHNVAGDKKEGQRAYAPTLLPLAALPVAKPRLEEKYVEMIAILGVKRQPQPSPTQMPYLKEAADESHVVEIASVESATAEDAGKEKEKGLY